MGVRSFIPPKPSEGEPNSFFMKSWFKTLQNFCLGGFSYAPVQTASFTPREHMYYSCDTTAGAITVTLPPAIGINGKPYTIKKISADANLVGVTVGGTDTIEGVVGTFYLTAGDSFRLVSDGQSNWLIEAIGASLAALASPLTTKGDLWGYAAVDARVPVGANTYVLTADSAQALGIKWAAPLTSPLTTKGDVWGYAAANARVPVGTDGKVLTADSGDANGVSWQTVSAGAPSNAQYLVLAADATLTVERVFTAGANISVVDGGAGAAYTVSASLASAPGITLGQALAMHSGFAGP